MRIRYDRFRDCIADPAVTIAAIPLVKLVAAKTLDHDVYIFCKTFDISALLLARRIRAANKVVGQDLFDDYFSQRLDPRLERFRKWLRDVAPVTQFAICSTPAMVEVVRPYMPGIPIVAVDDPLIGYDPLMVSALAEQKAQRALATRSIELVWFGIGDNPYFPVGLADLVGYEAALARIERQGWHVRLRIVTNRRPFDGGGAELLRAFSDETEFVEWSEEQERTALMAATVAILPVNGQSFSRAKSLNRAITAFNAGCQVLSLGYPLYDRVGDLLYRSIDELTADLAAGRCRVRGDTVATLTERLMQLANPFEAAKAFIREAQAALDAMPAKAAVLPLLCLVNGRVSAIANHKFANSMGGLSISTIFSGATWNFQLRFDQRGTVVVMRAVQALVQRFKLPVHKDRAPERIGDFDYSEIDVAGLGIEPMRLFLAPKSPPLHDLALYDDVMRFVSDCCRAAFGPIDLVVAEGSPLHRFSRTNADVS